MKKIFISLMILICISLVGCGTTLNVKVDGDVSAQSSGFIKICDDPIRLCYDSLTRIVYVSSPNGNGSWIKSAYYAPNGLPYRYNPEKNTFEEITNQD